MTTVAHARLRTRNLTTTMTMLASFALFHRVVAICLCVVALASCANGTSFDDDGGTIDPEDEPGAFIALQRDFQEFTSWERIFAGVGGITNDAPHDDVTRFVHVNLRPEASDDRFPVGTMIVKTHEDEALARTDWNIFAMVKRSPNFNVDGARGWEWFELKFDENDDVVIVWRGMTPPSGESYGCLTEECETRGSCNVCHAVPATDSVLTPDLDYSAQFSSALLDAGAH